MLVNLVNLFKSKEERYSRVPRLSDTRCSALAEMEICQHQNEIKIRHLPVVDRFKRYGS